MPIPEHTQGVLIMIDVAHNPTALGHNIRGDVPIKTASKCTRNRRRQRNLEMQIKYEIFNILLAQHNKFQYNGKGENTHTHRAWKMIYCTHTQRERETIEGDRYKDKLWSLPEQMLQLSPWQFEFNLEQKTLGMVRVWFGYGYGLRVEVDLCPVTAEKKRKRKIKEKRREGHVQQSPWRPFCPTLRH